MSSGRACPLRAKLLRCVGRVSDREQVVQIGLHPPGDQTGAGKHVERSAGVTVGHPVTQPATVANPVGAGGQCPPRPEPPVD